jgi:hypothetical protein
LTNANWLTYTTIDAPANQIGHGTIGVDPILSVRRIKLESTETQTGIRINCSQAFALFTADITVANDPIQVEGLRGYSKYCSSFLEFTYNVLLLFVVKHRHSQRNVWQT